VTVTSIVDRKIEEEQKIVDAIQDVAERQKAQVSLDAKKVIISILPEMGKEVKSVNDLQTKEIAKIAFEKIEKRVFESAQQDLFARDIIWEAQTAYAAVVEEYARNIIEIPRAIISQRVEVRSGFHDFALDTANLNFQPVSEEILIRELREQENNIDIIIGKGRIVLDTKENIIVNELMNFSEVDYDEQSDLLLGLAGNAVEKFGTYLDEDGVMNVVQSQKKEIARYIYSQMMEHFYCEAPLYEKPVMMSFTRIEEHNFEKYRTDAIYHYTETIVPTSAIPTKVFTGFKKACHDRYKFDSKTEKDLAVILEAEKEVIKWLRPASRQFRIYWNHNLRQYHPDFVVEASGTIYMVETKKEVDIASADVQEKSKAALEYCKNATEFTTSNGGKPWKYLLIPHNAVMMNMSFATLARQYEVT
jgi:type III restriction enzyme